MSNENPPQSGDDLLETLAIAQDDPSDPESAVTEDKAEGRHKTTESWHFFESP
ncbi:MAG: hypothetical protein JO076_11040 [Verrucomicrobia bacterium]|nr:hypothetical protein [Verrucomicrobiota bacterium]